MAGCITTSTLIFAKIAETGKFFASLILSGGLTRIAGKMDSTSCHRPNFWKLKAANDHFFGSRKLDRFRRNYAHLWCDKKPFKFLDPTLELKKNSWDIVEACQGNSRAKTLTSFRLCFGAEICVALSNKMGNFSNGFLKICFGGKH